MKKVNLFIVIILIFKICTAQDNTVKQDGYHIFKYPNNSVSSEGLIKNGMPDGFWKSYYVTGIKKSDKKN